MKIRRIDTVDNGIFKIKDQVEGESIITEIKEGIHEAVHCEPMFGYAINTKDGSYAWIPYHAVTTIFFEVSDD